VAPSGRQKIRADTVDELEDKPAEAEGGDELLWEEACRREEALRNLLRRHPSGLTRAAVDDTAWELGLSRASLYRLIRLFRAGGTVTALVPRSAGRPQGLRLLGPKREIVIRQALNEFYLKPTKPPFARLVHEIRTRCLQEGLPPPNWRTIKRRLLDVDVRTRARRRGETAILKATASTPGAYSASRPLEIVQIDHTKVDVIVVDEETGEPRGRPWLTLAMDVCTRMVTGFYLTMDAPSRLSISLCLLHAVYDKTAWLAEREIDASWPVAGLPEALHADNGADFRSRAFVRACRDEGIKTIWRKPGSPHYGGHIERLIGTQMGAVRLLPGTTMSGPEDRSGYDSTHEARLSLRELEQFVAWEIAGRYHQVVHSALRRPPIAVWREHEGSTVLRMPRDRLRFWVSFLPEEERTLRSDGIHLHGLRYWSSALAADVGRQKEKLLVKYDPRDLSRVFVQRPSGTFVEARYSDLTLPPISLLEAKAAMRVLHAKGRREVDTRTLVRTAVAQRTIVQNATRRARPSRRPGPGSNKSAVDDTGLGSLRGVDSRTPVPFVED
jgi:putative transposase